MTLEPGLIQCACTIGNDRLIIRGWWILATTSKSKRGEGLMKRGEGKNIRSGAINLIWHEFLLRLRLLG